MAVSSPASGTFDARALIKPAIHAMPAYRREEPPAVPPARTVRLDWNESGYGPSPKALAALRNLTDLHRYPEIDAHTLRHALGHYIDVPGEQVIVGAGLDDVLNTLAMLLLEPGDRVIISEPTFGVYRPLFSGHGAEVFDAPLTPEWALDVDAVLAAAERAKLIVVCNPNNPTGNLFDPVAVERVCAEAKCVVAIDEAYAEFAGVNHRPLMDRYPNVAILRTMSKFAGLAGMRVGYGAFPAALMGYLLRVMPAFCNVSVAATAMALASLDDLDYLNGVVARIVADREALAERLRTIPGVAPMASATNFVLVRLPVADAGPVVRELATRGVTVRSFGRPDLRPYLRVSVGAPDENAIFADELQSILEGGAA